MKINNSQWKNVKMSDSEKSLIRARLVQSIHTAPVLSPYHPRHMIFSFGMVGKMVATFSFLFVIIGGSAAANKALPGDLLYPFKVGVIEEIKSATYRTPAQKIVWQKTRVETRLKELESLSQKGTLTPENKVLVENQINTQLTTLNEQMTVAKDNPTQESKDAIIEVAKLAQTIEDHKEVLATLTTNVDKPKDEVIPVTVDAISTSIKKDTSKEKDIAIVKKDIVPAIAKIPSTLEQMNQTIEQAKSTVEEISSVIDGAPAHDIVQTPDDNKTATSTVNDMSAN